VQQTTNIVGQKKVAPLNTLWKQNRKASFPRAAFSSAAVGSAARGVVVQRDVTYFYERALLFPQRCWQGHGAASRGETGPRGWQRQFYADSEQLRRLGDWLYHALL